MSKTGRLNYRRGVRGTTKLERELITEHIRRRATVTPDMVRAICDLSPKRTDRQTDKTSKRNCRLGARRGSKAKEAQR